MPDRLIYRVGPQPVETLYVPDAQNHINLSRMKELGGETGVLLGPDLPLAGGRTEAGV